jgi:D-amino peptidase
MRHFVITDLEGVAGVDAWSQTGPPAVIEEEKEEAMDQLGAEVNACIEGIRSTDPDATIDVLDGHGPGGLHQEHLEGATYLRDVEECYALEDRDALYHVGQHAMAGTVGAPLRHTFSSTEIAYYKLNGTFIGEFGCHAFTAALQDTPAVLLTGDDKACHEAEMFVPGIETVAVKRGKGVESADHMDPDDACEAVYNGASRAAERIGAIPPLEGFEPPFELEIRFESPIDDGGAPFVTDDRVDDEHITRLDPYTITIRDRNPVEPGGLHQVL